MRVHEFSSTKQFIKRAYESSKKGNASLTIEVFARRLGMGGSSLKMIMAGKRRPTVYQTLSVARALRLSTEDTNYLENLALREAAKLSWQKAYYKKSLEEKKREAKLSTIHTAQKELLSDPSILPLLVFFMEKNKTEKIDYAKLAQDLRISESKVIELIDYFKSNEVLATETDGKFHVSFDKLSHRLLQKKYQKAVLADASARMDKEYDSPTSLFVSYAFSATEESLLQLQQDIKNLMAKYMMEGPTSEDQIQIAQACFQVFPVIKPAKFKLD
jgi:uncharacterized protein (TIGR02147 family)